jgi:hypothetical protein
VLERKIGELKEKKMVEDIIGKRAINASLTILPPY